MLRLRCLIALLAVLVAIASLSVVHAQQPVWLVLVYMAADSQPADEVPAMIDLSELMKVGSTSDVQIFVLLDRYSTSNSSLLHIHKGHYEYIWNGSEVNVGDPSTLVKFVQNVTSAYKAKKYLLVLWNHGGGWIGSMWDKDGDYLNLTELKSALAQINSVIGKKVDVLFFMACLMGMTEVAYQVKDYVRYLVASEEIMWGDYKRGSVVPFDRILQFLVSRPKVSPDVLSQVIAFEYAREARAFALEYYAEQGITAPWTISAVDLSKIDRVAASVNALGEKLSKYLTTYRNEIDDAHMRSQMFFLAPDFPDFADVSSFALQLLRERVPRDLKMAALDVVRGVRDAVLTRFDVRAVLVNGRPVKVYLYRTWGLSIYFPWHTYDPSYEKLDFASAAPKWVEFIRAYAQPAAS